MTKKSRKHREHMHMLSTMSRLSTSWVEELNFVRAGLALPSYEFELGLKIGGCS